MAEKIIKTEKLSKKYVLGSAKSGDLRQSFRNIFNTNRLKKRDVWALKDIDLEVEKGEVLGIIGPNGSGKSTLLKLLSRITSPTYGKATIKGRVSSLLEVGTGFHPELSGRENVFLNGSILGMKRHEIKNKFDRIVSFSGIEEFIDTPVKHYSSGMYVRLAFSVASHLDPEILLVDEVLSVGDMQFQEKSFRKMQEIVKSGNTILYVSHNLDSMRSFCSRSILLDKGKIKMDGKTDDVIDHYRRKKVSASTIALSDREDWGGSGDIRVQKIIFNEHKPILSGNALKIDIHYHSGISELDIAVQLDFKNSRGDLLFRCRNRYDGMIIHLKKNNQLNTLSCSIPQLPLNEGDYSVDVLFRKKKVFFSLDNAAQFSVQAEHFYKTGKLPENSIPFILEHHWKV